MAPNSILANAFAAIALTATEPGIGKSQGAELLADLGSFHTAMQVDVGRKQLASAVEPSPEAHQPEDRMSVLADMSPQEMRALSRDEMLELLADYTSTMKEGQTKLEISRQLQTLYTQIREVLDNVEPRDQRARINEVFQPMLEEKRNYLEIQQDELSAREAQREARILSGAPIEIVELARDIEQHQSAFSEGLDSDGRVFEALRSDAEQRFDTINADIERAWRETARSSVLAIPRVLGDHNTEGGERQTARADIFEPYNHLQDPRSDQAVLAALRGLSVEDLLATINGPATDPDASTEDLRAQVRALAVLATELRESSEDLEDRKAQAAASASGRGANERIASLARTWELLVTSEIELTQRLNSLDGTAISESQYARLGDFYRNLERVRYEAELRRATISEQNAQIVRDVDVALEEYGAREWERFERKSRLLRGEINIIDILDP